MRLLIVIFLTLILLAGGSLFLSNGGEAAVNVIGSTSLQPFAEMLSQEFNSTNPAHVIDVQGGGSTAGIQAVTNGVADVGMCSRALKDDEKQKFTPVIIARDGLAIVVHPENPVVNLTRDQIRHLFSGEIINWSQVGGENRVVRLITREEGSGTREAFTKLVMEAGHAKSRISRRAMTQESNGAVKELVKHDRSAIGYMSLGLVGHDLKAVQADGQTPTIDEVVAGRYPLVRPFLFVTKGPPSEAAQLFIDFVLSEKSQNLLTKEGLVPAR